MYFYCADPANKCVHCKTSWVIGRNLSNCSQCAKAVHAEHNDPSHDIAYDFYGQRIATCSSDQFVKVGIF